VSRNPSGCDRRGPDAGVLAAFELSGRPRWLAGDGGGVWRVGRAILRQGEPDDPRALWQAELYADLGQDGFRVPRPLRDRDGGWMGPAGWTAETLLDGRPPRIADVPACIAAIRAYHRALAPTPNPGWLDTGSAWNRADAACWGEPPTGPRGTGLDDLLSPLWARWEPLELLPRQIIHGDLHHSNLLVLPSEPVGIIDLAPYWGSADFALAMFANWVGPRRGRVNLLAYFADVPEFPQLLLRASIRMLLVIVELGHDQASDIGSERRAARLVLNWLDSR